MEYNKENYEGRRIWLFPNDTYIKKGIIILITEADKESGYRVGGTYFLNHASHLKFFFLD